MTADFKLTAKRLDLLHHPSEAAAMVVQACLCHGLADWQPQANPDRQSFFGHPSFITIPGATS
jgi:hypothetical protein